MAANMEAVIDFSTYSQEVEVAMPQHPAVITLLDCSPWWLMEVGRDEPQRVMRKKNWEDKHRSLCVCRWNGQNHPKQWIETQIWFEFKQHTILQAVVFNALLHSQVSGQLEIY